MKRAPVHILATVRKPELLDVALLVFQTFRKGFPTAPLMVWGNGLSPEACAAIGAATRMNGGTFHNLLPCSHDAWIEGLLLRLLEPFWICDTDMIFHSAIDSERDGEVVAGRFEPEFDEEWTGTRHMERLHTCLMWFDPWKVRAAMQAVMARIPHWGATAQFPFIRQHFVPSRGALLFYDSCAGLWQAGIGTPFSTAQNAAFDHLHCGTYADLISPHLHLPGNGSLRATHQAACANPESLNRNGSIQKAQADYYEERRPCPTIPR